MAVHNHAAARGTQHVAHAGNGRAHAAGGAAATGKAAAAGVAVAPTGFAALLSANTADTASTGAGDTADVAVGTNGGSGAGSAAAAGAGTASGKRLVTGAAAGHRAGSHAKTAATATATATAAAATGPAQAQTAADTVAGTAGKGGGKTGKAGDGLTDAPSGDTATLAAWAGLLQSQAAPAPAPLVAVGQAGGAAGAAALVAPAAGTNTAPISSGPQGRAAARSVQGLATTAGAVGTATATATAAAAPAARPGENAIVPANTTPAGDSPAVAAAPSAVLPQTLADGAAAPAAPGLPTPGTAPGPWRAANASTQAVLGRAHIAATAAAAAASPASSLSTGAITVDTAEGGAGAGRGAASTVSLGDGGQGRWAGMLSEIARPMAGESGAGGMSDGASPGRENAHDSRGADVAGPGNGGFAALGSGGENSGVGFAQTASGTATETQATAGGLVMTPDEWLAATTASINPRALQTAELTVDAFGSPVDVKISLSGADAQVTFQTDQADTRALLGSAVSDLQNLLRQEGLVLSGVSVGSSGSGAAGNPSAFQGDNGNRSRSSDALRGFTPDIAVSSAATASARSAEASLRGGLDLFA